MRFLDVLLYGVDFLNVRTEIMAFYFAYFLSFSLVILPFAQAVKRSLQCVNVTKTRSRRGSQAKQLSLSVIFSSFLLVKAMGEESGNIGGALGINLSWFTYDMN